MSLENYQRFSQAHQQDQQGNIAVAVDLCNQILKNSPEDADANNLLGIMATNQGNLSEANSSLKPDLVNIQNIFTY